MKVNSKLAVLFWLKGKADKEGKKQVYARITINGIRKEISVGKKALEPLWDQEHGRLNGKAPTTIALNRHFEGVKERLQHHYDTLELEHQDVSADMLKEAYLGIKRKKKSVLEAVNFVLDRLEKKVAKNLIAPATLVKWKTTKGKISTFLKQKMKVQDCSLGRIDYSFMEDFFDYLTLEEDLIPNSASKYVKNLKHVMRTAVQRKWINHNPAQEFVCNYIHPDRDILDEEELLTLHFTEFDIPRLQQAKDSYVFMCFTGYAYKDASLLEQTDLVKFYDGEDWIMKNREKTWCRENVPLLPIAKEIIQRYKLDPWCLEKNRLLPIRSNQKFNAYLKEIADLCHIKKNLTTHTARHTFATTVTLANDVPIETVSALLGHRSIKTTQIYARIVARKVSTDMKKLKSSWADKIPQSLLRHQAA